MRTREASTMSTDFVLAKLSDGFEIAITFAARIFINWTGWAENS